MGADSRARTTTRVSINLTHAALVIIVLGCVLLYRSYFAAPKDYQKLNEARNNCTELADIDRIAERLNDKLVCLSGPLAVLEPAKDPLFGMLSHAASLKRIVEIYQLVNETTTRVEFPEGKKTMDMVTDSVPTEKWIELVESPENRHTQIRAETFFPPSVKLGAFTLSRDVLQIISNWAGQELTIPTSTQLSYYKLYKNKLYLGDPTNYKVGDIRVSFKNAGSGEVGVKQDKVSLAAAQRAGGVLDNFNINGSNFLLVREGNLTMTDLFSQEESRINNMAWDEFVIGSILIGAALIFCCCGEHS